nr:MAG TPA: hypothetical protein [Bacteriophage sp.]
MQVVNKIIQKNKLKIFKIFLKKDIDIIIYII